MDDIRNIRRSLGLTQIAFAERLGLHQSTISRLETGEMEIDKRTRLAIRALQAECPPTDTASPDSDADDIDGTGGGGVPPIAAGALGAQVCSESSAPGVFGEDARPDLFPVEAWVGR